MIDIEIIPKRLIGIPSYSEKQKEEENIQKLKAFIPKQKDFSIDISDTETKNSKELAIRFLKIKAELEHKYKTYADFFDDLEIPLTHLLEEYERDPKNQQIPEYIEELIRPYRKYINAMIEYCKNNKTTNQNKEDDDDYE